jgi:hypothetical protein
VNTITPIFQWVPLKLTEYTISSYICIVMRGSTATPCEEGALVAFGLMSRLRSEASEMLIYSPAPKPQILAWQIDFSFTVREFVLDCGGKPLRGLSIHPWVPTAGTMLENGKESI